MATQKWQARERVQIKGERINKHNKVHGGKGRWAGYNELQTCLCLFTNLPPNLCTSLDTAAVA